MAEKLLLTGSTKLSDILDAYPWLKAKLTQIYEKFKLLNSPLGSIMLKTATITEMSKRSEMREDILIEKLGDLISSGN